MNFLFLSFLLFGNTLKSLNIFLLFVIILVVIVLVLEKNGLMDVDEDDVMMLVPPLFAPKDFPENLV